VERDYAFRVARRILATGLATANGDRVALFALGSAAGTKNGLFDKDGPATWEYSGGIAVLAASGNLGLDVVRRFVAIDH
jgi:hypothetical protein